MFSNEPLELSLATNPQLHHKLRVFIGHYDLRVYLTDSAYIDVDRGSFDAALMVRHTDHHPGCIGTVGQFCNFADSSVLVGGGAHWNQLPVNVVFNTIPTFALASQQVAELRPAPHTPFKIGNGVVISANATVMPGAVIGDGVVVAADGLARGELEPFTIYGGVPAKPIGQRFDAATRQAVEAVRWWDFDTVYLGNNMAGLQKLAVTSAEHVYRKPHPRIVLKLANGEWSFLSFIIDGVSRPLREAPPKVQNYLKQIPGPGPYYWLASMWAS